MIVHSYYRFEYPGQVTRDDIENVLGEPTLVDWTQIEPYRLNEPQCPLCNRLSDIYAGWGNDVSRVAFGLVIRQDGICMESADGGVHDLGEGANRSESAAFMSEARAALQRRLGITFSNYDDEDES